MNPAAPSAGGKLSPDQIASLMEQVGWTGPPETYSRGYSATVETGVAIAEAESGGDPLATNHNTNGTTDYGLWQINSVHAALLATHDWRNPLDNTRMAYAIWKAAGGSFTPWATYNSGAYKQHLGQGTSGDFTANHKNTLSLPNPLSGLDAIGAAFAWLGSAHNWLRILEVAGGAVAIVMGLHMLAESGALPDAIAQPVEAATGAAKHVGKAAAVAAVA